MKIGFLPFYIALYDSCAPQDAAQARVFARETADELRARGYDVVAADVCRIRPEFQKAVLDFEKAGCEAILTLHLAYSPSLEAIDALTTTKLPIVIMDTTADVSFTDPSTQLMANHGIHGVQDFGNLLGRRGKRFLIAAGGLGDNLFSRLDSLLKSAAMSYKMNHLRIGRVGGEFIGMGDFQFAAGSVGLQEIPWQDQAEPAAEDVAREMAEDKARFTIACPQEIHETTIRASLKLRRWAEKENLDGFTVNFGGVTRQDGWQTIPFLECSKAMERGLGYAGEGDVLTAGLMAAMLRGGEPCSFAEMFCPDWKGNRIFTSHMGEINLAVVNQPPVLKEKNYNLSDTGNPAVAYGCFRPGQALWIDLAPIANNRFRLIASPIEFLEQPADQRDADYNAGWFTVPRGTIADFLEEYTRQGGTHHAVVVYDGKLDTYRNFASLMGWEFAAI